MYPYGISIDAAYKLVPKCIDMQDSVIIGNLNIMGFPSDCGALVIHGANYASKADIKNMLLLASHTGHNKIFCTIVGSQDMVDKQTKLFVNAGFTIIHTGKSNRTSYYKDVVLFHHNPDCHKKGY